MYATADLYNRYKQDYIVTANPMDLIIMLYDGVIKQLKLTRILIDSKSMEKAHKCLTKAQDIILELLKSLDMNYKISADLMKLYDFYLSELVQINITKDVARIEPILEMFESLKEAWQTIKNSGTNNYVADEEVQ